MPASYSRDSWQLCPAETKHRLENPGKLPLHVIESQIGDYLEEDDIVRFDDDF